MKVCIVGSGGRVLGVTALGDTLEDARGLLYGEIIPRIHFDGKIYRADIGRVNPN